MRRGATLISTLVGIGFLAVVLVAVVQLHALSSAAVAVADARSRALMVAEAQIERLHAGGYAALPAVGQHVIEAPASAGLPGASGTLTISEGPARDSRLVTVTITWRQRPERQESRVSLSRIIAGGGMGG
jgi:Tfp pilus assembly protein PilV